MAGKGRSKIKASWNKCMLHMFCDICIREIEDGNRPGPRLTGKGWKNVILNFEKETGQKYDMSQLRSKWDVMKRVWKQWKLLIENETEIKWNSKKGTIDASDDWWEKKIKVIPEAKRFRRHGLEPELQQKLDKMFTVVCDLDEYAPVPSDSEDLDYTDELVRRPRKRQSRNDYWQDKLEKMGLAADPRSCDPTIRNNQFENITPSKGSPKVELVVDPDPTPINQPDRLPDECESRSKAPLTKCDHTCSITDAIHLLDSINEVPKASALYYFAIKLILNQDKREVFMALTPETKVWWLKMEEKESTK